MKRGAVTFTPMGATIVIAGATGLTGAKVLEQALRDERVEHIITPVRRALPEARKLEQWIDPELENSLRDSAPGAVICCLGTTMKQVGGDKQKFIHVDKELIIVVAEWAKRNGAKTFCVISAMGANASSNIFYNKVKGQTEDALLKIGFQSLYLFQPSILDGGRAEQRSMEKIALAAMKLLKPLIPANYRPMPVDVLAGAMLNAAYAGIPGEHVARYHDIIRGSQRPS